MPLRAEDKELENFSPQRQGARGCMIFMRPRCFHLENALQIGKGVISASGRICPEAGMLRFQGRPQWLC